MGWLLDGFGLHPSMVIFSLSLLKIFCIIALSSRNNGFNTASSPQPSPPSGMCRDDAGESSCLLIMACRSVLINLPCRKDLSLRRCEKAAGWQCGLAVGMGDGAPGVWDVPAWQGTLHLQLCSAPLLPRRSPGYSLQNDVSFSTKKEETGANARPAIRG